MLMPVKSVNEIMKRLVELCGYTWNPMYEYSDKEMLEFPEYLEAITKYFEKFNLNTSLTCQVGLINDIMMVSLGYYIDFCALGSMCEWYSVSTIDNLLSYYFVLGHSDLTNMSCGYMCSTCYSRTPLYWTPLK